MIEMESVLSGIYPNYFNRLSDYTELIIVLHWWGNLQQNCVYLMGNLAFCQFAILTMFVRTYVSCSSRNTFLLDRSSKIRYRKSHDKTVVSVTIQRGQKVIPCLLSYRMFQDAFAPLTFEWYIMIFPKCSDHHIERHRLFVYRLFAQLFLSY